jgi:protocatechuate 3,4-dioxygenase beta subunit
MDRDRRNLVLAGCALSSLASVPTLAAARERVLGGPCEGCDWVFSGMPARFGSVARIAPPEEPGDRMTLQGIVSSAAGPVAGVIVYAYHTNRAGVYPAAANRHGALRGWAMTDRNGRYRFDSIRPGAYPSHDIAQHVHMHVIEPGVGTYYIDNVEFLDDPLLDPSSPQPMRGGSGRSQPLRRDDGWDIRRDIALGRNIPGYEPRRTPAPR